MPAATDQQLDTLYKSAVKFLGAIAELVQIADNITAEDAVGYTSTLHNYPTFQNNLKHLDAQHAQRVTTMADAISCWEEILQEAHDLLHPLLPLHIGSLQLSLHSEVQS